MFPKNSVLRRIFALVGADPKLGHRWVRLNGLLRRQTAARIFALQLVIGSKLVNRTTGYTKAKLYGTPNGRLSKSAPANVARKCADRPIMIRLIVNEVRLCGDSGT